MPIQVQRLADVNHKLLINLTAQFNNPRIWQNVRSFILGAPRLWWCHPVWREIHPRLRSPYINMARDQKELAYKNVSLTSGEDQECVGQVWALFFENGYSMAKLV